MSQVKTFADKIVRLDGWTREDSIYEIMAIDCISECEAIKRYEAAQKRLFSSLKAANTKKEISKMATEDAKSGYGCYNKSIADKYKTYRIAFTNEINKLGASS